MSRSARLRLLLLLLPVSAFSALKPVPPLAVTRLKWVHQLRHVVAQRGWPAFNRRGDNIPVAYFTAGETYVFNPTASMIRRLALTPYYQDRVWQVYRSARRVDQQLFHMETAYDEQDSTRLYWRQPVVQCSDYETATHTQPDVPNLQKWAAMVVHETFHGVQFQHPDFLRFATDSVPVSGGRLQGYYDTHQWYRTAADRENALLLQSLDRGSPARTDSLLRRFVRLREQRRRLAADSLEPKVARLEDFYEKLEGSARYSEWQLFLSYGQPAARYAGATVDPAYRPGPYARFGLRDEPWLYQTSTVRYYYATGFNLLRVLDQLHISYKGSFFADNRRTPYGLLRRHLDKSVAAATH